MKRFILAAALLAAIASPVIAQQPDGAAVQSVVQTEGGGSDVIAAAQTAAQRNQTLATSEGVRLGRVVRAHDDGSVAIIFDSGVVTIPANRLSIVNDRLVTSLTRRDVHRLR